MNREEVERILRATLEDGRVTRSERQALRALIEDWGASPQALARLRSHAFDVARAASSDFSPDKLLTWVEEIMKVTLPAIEEAVSESVAEAHFSPGEACRNRIAELIGDCKKTADLCVFTITDDLISKAIARAHDRGVEVRVISDDRKSEDRGSDVDRLARFGVSVRTDHSSAHMHHKFAVFDGGQLVTGSYNWTRSAFLENQENIVVTADPRLVRKFMDTFESLWTGSSTSPHHAAK